MTLSNLAIYKIPPYLISRNLCGGVAVLRVLISGIGIAGPVIARRLADLGHVVTLVERAPGPRPGGQAIDVRGTALDVLSDLDALEAARARRTSMTGVSVVDLDGHELWRSEQETLSGGRFDAGDVEILRDDLAGVLLDRLGKKAEMIYGDRIVALRQNPEAVEVRFAGAGSRFFDLVIGADGVGSAVRDLAFDGVDPVQSLGTALAIFTTPNLLALKDWQVAYREGRGGFLLYTARQNRELRVAVGFPLDPDAPVPVDVRDQKALVLERCARFRWEMPRIFACMEKAADFYFGPVAQVHLDQWWTGRVGLVGDAAYCPSPFSGQGTSLALVGAHVLATEIGKTPDDHQSAFIRYQERMVPYVAANQALALLDQDDDSRERRLKEAKRAIML